MRGIKPEFWTNGAIAALSPLARCLFIGMWHYCCDNGHLTAKPRDLKIRVLPLDVCNVEELLAEIVEAEPDDPLLVEEDGQYTVPNLRKHQQIHSRWETKCPRCDNGGSNGGSTVADNGGTTGAPREDTGGHGGATDEVKGSEVKGSESRRRGRATVAPDSLDLDAADKAWAAEKCPAVDLDDATEEFLTWAKSVDKRYVDWKAAWRNAMKRRQSWAKDSPAKAADDATPDWMLA